jgi:hypothetical protein
MLRQQNNQHPCVMFLILYLFTEILEGTDMQIQVPKQNGTSLMGCVIATSLISLHGESLESG